MVIKKNKSYGEFKDFNIVELVRDEVQKALEKERHHRKHEISTQHQQYYNKAKREILSDLIKAPIKQTFQDNFGKNIASQIVKSIISKI